MDKCAGAIVDRMPEKALSDAWTNMGWEIIVAK
jgi:hypothetical protein